MTLVADQRFLYRENESATGRVLCLPLTLSSKAILKSALRHQPSSQGGPAPYIPPCLPVSLYYKACWREIQRLPYFPLAAVSTFPALSAQRWEGYTYNDRPILSNVPNSRVVLCAGRPNARSGRVGLDFLALPFASRQKVEKIDSEEILKTKSLIHFSHERDLPMHLPTQ